jgi:hypothetical protein
MISPFEVVTFRQSEGEPEYWYKLEQKPIALNDYYYHESLGNFCSIQHCLHKEQLTYNFPVVVETNNPNLKIINHDT